MMQRKTNRPARAASFGYRDVDPKEKATLVREVFDSVANRYDLMNDLMSWGVHRLWKTALIDRLKPRADMHLLDVAGGTGDIALRYLDAGGGRVTVLDVNYEMVSVGRNRAIDHGVVGGLQWVVGDAESLPVADGVVDVYTIAFGLRNVTDMDRALREVRRVLKPGGRFLCLEFSHVVLPLLSELYDRYSFTVVPALGARIAGDADAYRYLVESIRRFPDQETLVAQIQSAGLEQVRLQNLSGGIAAIHTAWRI